MASVVVEEFDARHVPGAAKVLRSVHRSHLTREPLLADAPDYELLVHHEYEGASGAVALDGNTVVGYLLGRHSEGTLGPHVWSTSAGHAVNDPDLIFELYARASSGWVEAGLPRHFVFAPADQEHVEPWFRLGFGASAYQGARRVDEPRHDDVPGDLVVRLSVHGDLPEIVALAREQSLHLKASPSFSEIPVASEEEVASEWGDTWEREDYTHFVAMLDGQIAGQLLLHRRPPGDLRTPENSIDLASATTGAGHRGLGIGRTLTSVALEWAVSKGFVVMTADWRATNLVAARFWPHRGFRATFIRLYRSIP